MLKGIKSDKRSDRIPKSTKKIFTLAELFPKDTVKDAIEYLLNEQDNITDWICVYRDQHGKPACITTTMEVERAIHLLESIKFEYLKAQSSINNETTEVEDE